MELFIRQGFFNEKNIDNAIDEFENNLQMALKYDNQEQFVEFIGDAINCLSTRNVIDRELGLKILQRMKFKR